MGYVTHMDESFLAMPTIHVVLSVAELNPDSLYKQSLKTERSDWPRCRNSSNLQSCQETINSQPNYIISTDTGRNFLVQHMFLLNRAPKHSNKTWAYTILFTGWNQGNTDGRRGIWC